MLRFLRLRYLLLYLLLGLGYFYIDWQPIFKAPVTRAINTALAPYGFANPQFDITELSARNLIIENMRLDQDGVNTIDRIEVKYSLWGLVMGRAQSVTIIKPDLIFDPIQWPESTGSTSISPGPFRLSSLPFDNLTISDLSLSMVGDDINPSVNGDVTIQPTTINDASARVATINLKGAEKDFTLALSARVTEADNGDMNIKMEIPAARFDLPGLMMARAHGKLELDIPDNAPLSATGEWSAGAMRIGTLPLDDLSIVASGRKPDLSIIGNAGITGLPMTSLSLRMAEDQNGANLLIQISGDAPEKLRNLLAPTLPVTVNGRQKFILMMDMKDDTLTNLMTAPYQGGVFLYNEDTTPLVTAGFGCPGGPMTCTVKVPETHLSSPHINQFIQPWLNNMGLELSGGSVTGSGTFDMAQPQNTVLSLRADRLSGLWQGLAFNDTNGMITRTADQSIALEKLKGGLLGGKWSVDDFAMNSEFSGKTIINFSELRLEDLSKFLQIEGLDVTGRASGRLPLDIARGVPTVRQGGKLSGLNGTIKYNPVSYPGFLGGEDERMNVLRQSLTDYQFDTLTLDFKGDLMGIMNAQLAAKGRNEKLFDKRPLHINLNFEGPLAPAIQQLMPYLTQAAGETP